MTEDEAVLGIKVVDPQTLRIYIRDNDDEGEEIAHVDLDPDAFDEFLNMVLSVRRLDH